MRSLTLDGWEPEIVKVMVELGNDVVNNIYESNYEPQCSSSYDTNLPKSLLETLTVRRATSDCDVSIRETWIKAKYVEKKFVAPISGLITSRSNFTQKTHFFNDIVHGNDGWLVRKRSRDKIDLRMRTEKPMAVDDSAYGIEISVDTFDDDSSTSDMVSLYGFTFEKFEDLNSDMLLYKSTITHNLPIMNYAVANGASKGWHNSKDSNKFPIHQAVLSVRKYTFVTHSVLSQNHQQSILLQTKSNVHTLVQLVEDKTGSNCRKYVSFDNWLI